MKQKTPDAVLRPGAEGWELLQVVNTEVFVDADNGHEEGQDSEVVDVLFNYFFKRSID